MVESMFNKIDGIYANNKAWMDNVFNVAQIVTFASVPFVIYFTKFY